MQPLLDAAGVSGVPVPVPPAQTSGLHQLSIQELESLLADDAAFEKYLKTWIASLPAALALNDVQSQNLALAHDNIAMQSALDEARNHVAIVKSSEFAAAKSIFDDLLQSQRQVCSCLAPSVLLDKLAAAVNEVDEQSISLHDRFLKGEVPPDQFAEQHAELRTKFHTLDLKRQAARSSIYQ